MACCCDQSGLSGLYGLDGLNGLMGQLSLPPVKKGARFQFGYNVGYTAGGFRAEGVAEATNAAGLTFDAVSSYLAGVLNPFIALEGRSNRDWNSGSDFRDALNNAIAGAGYPIEPQSIQFNVETVSDGYTPPPVSSTRPPGTGGGSQIPGADFFDQIAASLNVTKQTAQMLAFGGGLLLLVMVLKR